MTTRVLPREEWPRLTGTEAETVWPQLSDQARIVVVEDGDQIVGCHVLVAVLHAECLWIHPAHRGKAGVARRLWAAVVREAREHFGATWFATACVSEDVRDLLTHVGAVQIAAEAEHYMVPVGGA